MIPSRVTLVDVGPRDGLQNEKQTVDAAVKIELVHRLQAAGLREIEVTSFVSPKWVPQMADNAAVMAGIERKPGVRYSVLMPNMKGLDAALSAPRADGRRDRRLRARRPRRSARRTSTARSPRASSASRRSSPRRTRKASRCAAPCRCALGCPYQGEVTADEVERVVALMKAPASTTAASPTRSASARRRKRPGGAWSERSKHYPVDEVSGHFHDTYGQAHRQRLRQPRGRHRHLRRQRRRPRRLPVREGRDRQRRHRGRAVPARRPRHRHRRLARRRGRRGGVHLGRARSKAGVAVGQRVAREAGGGFCLSGKALRSASSTEPRQAAGGWPDGASPAAVWPCEPDCPAVLGLGACRRTRCVRCALCAQTAAASQLSMRAARAAPSPPLLGAAEATPPAHARPAA